MFDLLPGLNCFGFLVVLWLGWAQFAVAEMRGIMGAPTGIGELRTEKNADAPVVANVKTGESFSFEVEEGNEWGKVKIETGKSGWLPISQIRLFFDEADLPKKEPSGLSEIDEAAHRLGLDYVKVTGRAAKGDIKALKQFFTLAQKADGAAAECLVSIPTVVYHILGDEKFARFLDAQPVSFQTLVRSIIVGDGRLPPTTLYLERHFPKTTKVLFPSEITAWPSPDGRYTIRKVFSDPFDLGASKIIRAELIEKKTGQVLLDMTGDDIGAGPDREGEILWSPDSKRFASLSTGMNQRQGNLFSEPRPGPHKKQTLVYQVMGDVWSPVELPLEKVPGREGDTELEGAILGHDYIEPIRWKKPNVLLLERHEYYRKLKPQVVDGLKFESIVDLARWYSITVTISPEGKATLVWKVKEQ